MINTLNLENLKSVEDLQKQGKFKEIKEFILYRYSILIKTRSWIDLFNKIQKITTYMQKNEKNLRAFISDLVNKTQKFNLFKEQILDKFNIKFKIKEDHLLMLNNFFYLFNRKLLNFLIYTKNKLNNFIASSKLEGIHIETTNSNLTPEERIQLILERYKHREK